jgi:hypothetical protein
MAVKPTERDDGEHTCGASSSVAPAQKRGTMPRGRVGPPLLAGAQPVLDVTPVVRRGVGRIDADRLDLIDCVQNATDVRPARDAEKDSPPGRTKAGWNRARRRNCVQDVDAGNDLAEIIRRAANEGEGAALSEAPNADAAIEDRLLGDPAEADPVFDSLLEPGQLDICQRIRALGHGRSVGLRDGVQCAPPSLSGNSWASRSRSMSATVSPRLKAVMTRVACQLRRLGMERVAGKADDAEGPGNPTLAR